MITEVLRQEGIQPPEYIGGPKVRALELMMLDRALYGYVQPETKTRILDEEHTWVAELVAQQTEYAVIPRMYQRIEGDFVDIHGVGIHGVMQAGRDSINDAVSQGELGAKKEQTRRAAESRNFEKQLSMSPNNFMVELSLTDTTWTEAEQKRWGYSGDTLVRITYVNDLGDVEQDNICLQLSGSKFARALHEEFKLSGTKTAESILANPHIGSFHGDMSELMLQMKRRIAAAERSAHPVLALASKIRQFKKQKQDAWKLVTGNQDLSEKLWSEFESIALHQPAHTWESHIEDARRGFWKLSLESADSKTDQYPSESISGAAVRSRNDGDTFTACGDTSEAGPESVSTGLSYASRLVIVASLNEKKGAGSCDGCNDYSDLYGCGGGGTFCRSCNDTWCKEYLTTGKMLEGKQLLEAKYRRYMRRTGWFI
jgi:hypothetical protein